MAATVTGGQKYWFQGDALVGEDGVDTSKYYFEGDPYVPLLGGSPVTTVTISLINVPLRTG